MRMSSRPNSPKSRSPLVIRQRRVPPSNESSESIGTSAKRPSPTASTRWYMKSLSPTTAVFDGGSMVTSGASAPSGQ